MYSRRLQRLTPYTPGEQPQDRKYIKLNTNESPFPPSPGVVAALRNFDETRLRLYPDPNCVELRSAIATYHGVSIDNVFVGNGSDEVLSLSYYAFFDSQSGPLQMPDLSFSFYPVFANFHGVDIRSIPLGEDFSINLDRFLSEDHSCGTIFANPNAPTGLRVPRNEVSTFLDRYSPDSVVISDEAYVEFGGETTLPLLSEHENLLIVTTCSKSRSLAGARLGYALGNGPLISALFAAKNSFNSYTVNAVTQAMGKAAFEDAAYYDDINRRIVEIRNAFIHGLHECGWEVLPSATNFVLTRCPRKTGLDIYTWLRDNGVLVRHFSLDRISDYVRISIGNDAEMQTVLKLVRGMAE